jgi:hypothetical protein
LDRVTFQVKVENCDMTMIDIHRDDNASSLDVSCNQISSENLDRKGTTYLNQFVARWNGAKKALRLLHSAQGISGGLSGR